MTEQYMLELHSRVRDHHLEALTLEHPVMVTVLQGSQNYDLELENGEYVDGTPYISDVDTKCIVLPTFDEFCQGKQPISSTHERENKEHIDLKDIRIMFDTFKKQNINFVEVLFSDFYRVNIDYLEEWNELQALGERLVHCHPSQTLRTMAGQSMEKRKALEHPYPTIKWKIDKWGFDGKQLSHILRINEFMKNYLKGIPFKECLKNHTRESWEMIIRAKLNDYPLDQARELAQRYDDENKALKDDYISQYGDGVIDPGVYEELNDIKVRILRKHFKKELEIE